MFLFTFLPCIYFALFLFNRLWESHLQHTNVGIKLRAYCEQRRLTRGCVADSRVDVRLMTEEDFETITWYNKEGDEITLECASTLPFSMSDDPNTDTIHLCQYGLCQAIIPKIELSMEERRDLPSKFEGYTLPPIYRILCASVNGNDMLKTFWIPAIQAIGTNGVQGSMASGGISVDSTETGGGDPGCDNLP